jgi:hypothetical protein
MSGRLTDEPCSRCVNGQLGVDIAAHSMGVGHDRGPSTTPALTKLALAGAWASTRKKSSSLSAADIAKTEPSRIDPAVLIGLAFATSRGGGIAAVPEPVLSRLAGEASTGCGACRATIELLERRRAAVPAAYSQATNTDDASIAGASIGPSPIGVESVHLNLTTSYPLNGGHHDHD